MISYRAAEERDRAFIIDSWVNSYRTAHAAGLIAMDTWREVMSPQVERILARDGCDTWVAYDPDDDSGLDLYGWASVERGYQVPGRVKKSGRWEKTLKLSDIPLIHYVFVKEPYRRQRIAKTLLSRMGVNPYSDVSYSCRTGIVSRLAEKNPAAKWQPLIVRYPKEKP